MNLRFDFGQVETVEFGVGLDETDGQSFQSVTVDGDVQDALKEMAEATWGEMQDIATDPGRFDPSDKHGNTDHVYLRIGDDLAQRLRQLHEAQNLQVDNTALSDPTKLFCYFARMTDRQGRRLTAVRRATQFKGILKSRLIRLVTDALKMIEDDVFKLDNDFDLIIDAANVHILRPSGFEFVCELQGAILAAVPENVNAIQADLSFVDFTAIQEYAGKHPRAARYLASIRSQDIRNVDPRALKRQCKNTSVEVHMVDGKITVEEAHVMGFLEVLDRRRYDVTLIKDTPERYRATSREKLKG